MIFVLRTKQQRSS